MLVLFPFPYSLLTVYWLSKPALAPSECLVWSENDPLEYSHHLPPLHTSGPNHVLLQIGPALIDVDGEYRGGVMEEEMENEGGDASIE